MLIFILALAVQGLIVGAFARLALPGRDPMSLLQTMGVGLAGSFAAGLLFYLISGGSNRGPGFLISLVFSVAIVYAIRRHRGGGLTQPGDGSRRR